MDPLAQQAWPDRAIARIAATQATMIATWQLLELGVSHSSIADAVRRGRLHRVHRGVYSLVAPRARPRWAAEHAALLACGPTAVLSHHSAARVHGLQLPGRPKPAVHLTVPPHGRGRCRAGIRVHRSNDLPADEIGRVDGLRVTSLARVIVDLSATLDPRVLEPLIDRALRTTSRAKLDASAQRHARRPGVPLLRALLDPARPSADAWSRTEARLRAMLIRAGVPVPECNVEVAGLVPDLSWRRYKVLLEYDSETYHFGTAGARRTWQRHNVLQTAGYVVIHVTWEDLSHHRERLLVRVVAALTRAGWVPD